MKNHRWVHLWVPEWLYWIILSTPYALITWTHWHPDYSGMPGNQVVLDSAAESLSPLAQLKHRRQLHALLSLFP